MRLLLVEDDQLLGRAMQISLLRAGYAADWVRSGRDFDTAMSTHRYGCAILDLGLPDRPGEELLHEARSRRTRIPFIVVTARGGIQDRIALLDAGADDYLTKPFDLDELTARIRSVTRRAAESESEEETLSYGNLHLSPATYVATWNGKDILLTHREYAVLEALVRRKGQVLTRARLEEALYGWGEEIGSNTVEVYIHFLRRKIHYGIIETVRGLGYQLSSIEHA